MLKWLHVLIDLDKIIKLTHLLIGLTIEMDQSGLKCCIDVAQHECRNKNYYIVHTNIHLIFYS